MSLYMLSKHLIQYFINKQLQLNDLSSLLHMTFTVWTKVFMIIHCFHVILNLRWPVLPS